MMEAEIVSRTLEIYSMLFHSPQVMAHGLSSVIAMHCPFIAANKSEIYK
jgi:hypothetical protein